MPPRPIKLANFLRLFAVAALLAGYSAWALSERAPGAARTVPANTLPLVRLAEARRLWQDPQTLFIDVRPADDYAAGHIHGAIHLPEDEFERRFPALQPRLEQAQALVVYCDSRDCGKSLWTAIRLRNEGLTQTRIYPEGWNEWFANGLPAERTNR